MAIIRCSSADLGNNGGTTNNLTASFANSGNCLLLGVWSDFGYTPTVTFNGVAMTLLTAASGTTVTPRSFSVFILLGAPLVTANFVITSPATDSIFALAVSYLGVASVRTPDNAAANIASSAPNPYTNTYSTVADNCWGVGFAFSAGIVSPIAFSNSFTTVIGTATYYGIGDTNAAVHPAGSLTMTTTTGSFSAYQGFVSLCPANVAFITNGMSTPWVLPSDWPGYADYVGLLGCGGTGSARVSSTRGGSGGGGGAFVGLVGPYTISANPSFAVPAGGGAANTTFNTSAFVAAFGANGTTSLAGAGGTSASSTVPAGGVKYTAGSGLLPPTSNAEGGGGGGASGPLGAGQTAPSNIGGYADNNRLAAPAAGTVGSNGTEFDSTHGAGTGASGPASGSTAFAGGKYGGGGSGHGAGSTGAGGTGEAALIVIYYSPSITPSGAELTASPGTVAKTVLWTSAGVGMTSTGQAAALTVSPPLTGASALISSAPVSRSIGMILSGVQASGIAGVMPVSVLPPNLPGAQSASAAGAASVNASATLSGTAVGVAPGLVAIAMAENFPLTGVPANAAIQGIASATAWAQLGAGMAASVGGVAPGSVPAFVGIPISATAQAIARAVSMSLAGAQLAGDTAPAVSAVESALQGIPSAATAGLLLEAAAVALSGASAAIPAGVLSGTAVPALPGAVSAASAGTPQILVGISVTGASIAAIVSPLAVSVSIGVSGTDTAIAPGSIRPSPVFRLSGFSLAASAGGVDTAVALTLSDLQLAFAADVPAQSVATQLASAQLSTAGGGITTPGQTSLVLPGVAARSDVRPIGISTLEVLALPGVGTVVLLGGVAAVASSELPGAGSSAFARELGRQGVLALGGVDAAISAGPVSALIPVLVAVQGAPLSSAIGTLDIETDWALPTAADVAAAGHLTAGAPSHVVLPSVEVTVGAGIAAVDVIYLATLSGAEIVDIAGSLTAHLGQLPLFGAEIVGRGADIIVLVTLTIPAVAISNVRLTVPSLLVRPGASSLTIYRVAPSVAVGEIGAPRMRTTSPDAQRIRARSIN